MPSPSVQRQLISIPFKTGLSQKEDSRYLEPGALVTAQNAVKNKSGVLDKRPGMSWLTTTGYAPVSGLTATIASGARIGRFVTGQLCIIGQDTVASVTWGDAVWLYDEQSQKPVWIDRAPEVYCFPPEQAVGGDVFVVEQTIAICNGYKVLAWNNNGTLFYKVMDAATGDVVVPGKSCGFSLTAPINGPKLIACGTKVIMGLTDGTATLWASSLDMTSPHGSWSALSALKTSLVATVNNWYAYDIAPVVGDATQFAAMCQTETGSRDSWVDHLWLLRCAVSGLSVSASADIAPNDATFQSDQGSGSNQVICDSFAVLPDKGNGDVACAYSWRTATPATRVSVQVEHWPTIGTNYSAAVDCYSVPGPLSPSSDLTPWLIGLARVTDLSGGSYPRSFRVKWSPHGGLWVGVPPVGSNGYPSATTTAYIAGYIVYDNSGSMAVQNGSPRVTYGLVLASQLYVNNALAYYVGCLPNYTQGTFYLMCDDSTNDYLTTNYSSGGYKSYFPDRMVGILAPRLAAGYVINVATGSASRVAPAMAVNPLREGGLVVETVLPVAYQPTIGAPTIFAFDFKSPRAYQMAELGENLGIASGVPSASDGARVFEFGFPMYPIITATGSGGSGSFNGTYSYIATYEWWDARGQRHQSARSVSAQVTASSAANLSVTVQSLPFTGREKSSAASFFDWQGTNVSPQSFSVEPPLCRIRIWRTVAGGNQYFNLDAADALGSLVNAQTNNQGDPAITVTDTVTDAVLQTHEQLYGDGSDGTQEGNNVDNLCPPAFQCLITHKQRFYGADGNNVWASKAFTQGEGSAFNELMAFSVDDGPSHITALASLDDKLIIFKRDRIFYVEGSGPLDNMGGNDWTDPQRIASDGGAVDWRSVVTCPEGVYFMSEAGRRLLTRDLQVKVIHEVTDTDDSNPTFTSAILHPSQTRLLWTQATDLTMTDGLAVDHEYVLDSWSTRTSASGPFASACIADVPSLYGASQFVAGRYSLVPTYHVLQSSGIVGREASDSWLDGGSFVSLLADTPWIKAAQFDGFARFRRLLVSWQNNDPHALSVYVAYDFSSSWTLMGTITAAQMTAMTTPICEQLFPLPRQRARAVRFRITDAQDGMTSPITGQGPTLISLGLEVGFYTNNRTARVPSSQVQ